MAGVLLHETVERRNLGRLWNAEILAVNAARSDMLIVVSRVHLSFVK